MADLIMFPETSHRRAAAYQLHRFAPDGSVRTTVLVLAYNDAEAKQHARGLTKGLRAQLWLNGRLLEHLAPGDHPVAESIRLLCDPATTSET